MRPVLIWLDNMVHLGFQLALIGDRARVALSESFSERAASTGPLYLSRCHARARSVTGWGINDRSQHLQRREAGFVSK